jgi:hypothetical protein
VAHAPQLHILGAVPAIEPEAQLAQEGFQRSCVVRLDLGEIEAGRFCHLRQRGQFHGVAAPAGRGGRGRCCRLVRLVEPFGALLFEPNERAHGVHGGALNVGLAEDVIEDLQ